MHTFGLIGNGLIAQRHKSAIEANSGTIEFIYDPFLFESQKNISLKTFLETAPFVDFYVICSPSNFHYQQTKDILYFLNYKSPNPESQIIVEKPACLPWEPLIDDDSINIILQYHYLEITEPVDHISIKMVRNKGYFQSWKGQNRLTGGTIYNLFIHYLDLALRHRCSFIGRIVPDGMQSREIIFENGKKLHLLNLDVNKLYAKMYAEIIQGNGIKPKDIFLLKWLMDRLLTTNALDVKNLTITKSYINQFV